MQYTNRFSHLHGQRIGGGPSGGAGAHCGVHNLALGLLELQDAVLHSPWDGDARHVHRLGLPYPVRPAIGAYYYYIIIYYNILYSSILYYYIT